MKKLLLVSVTVLILAYEDASAQFFSIGPKAGISSSAIQVDERFDYNGGTVKYNGGGAKLGFHVGLYTRLKIPLLGLYVQPEALYVRSGGAINVDDNGSVTTSDVSLSKFDVPVILGIRLVKILRLYVGPNFSFLINANTDEDLTLSFKSTTVAYQAGLGLDLGRLGIDLKYEGNMSALGEQIEIGGLSFSTDVRNPQFILSLGWRL